MILALGHDREVVRGGVGVGVTIGIGLEENTENDVVNDMAKFKLPPGDVCARIRSETLLVG